jgi:hypothetical protein
LVSIKGLGSLENLHNWRLLKKGFLTPWRLLVLEICDFLEPQIESDYFIANIEPVSISKLCLLPAGFLLGISFGCED